MKKLLFVILIIAITGCSQKIVPPGERGYSLKTAAAVKGQDVFMRNCNRCHPGGMGGLAPSIVNKPLPGFLMKFQVRHGLGVMPSFDKKRFPKEDLNNLIVYLKERHKKF